MLEIRKAIAEIYLFLWELRIKIKIMPQAEFERMVGKLTAEQKVYAIKEQAKDAANAATAKTKKSADKIKEKAQEKTQELKEKAQHAANIVKEKATQAADTVKQGIDSIHEKSK